MTYPHLQVTRPRGGNFSLGLAPTFLLRALQPPVNVANEMKNRLDGADR